MPHERPPQFTRDYLRGHLNGRLASSPGRLARFAVAGDDPVESWWRTMTTNRAPTESGSVNLSSLGLYWP